MNFNAALLSPTPLLSGGSSAGNHPAALFGGFGGVAVQPPQVENFTPDPSVPIQPSTALAFDVTDPTDLFRDIFVFARFAGTPLYEVIWDGAAFAPLYVGGSTVTTISHGFHFSLVRASGWPSSPTIAVHAIDPTGQEAS